MTYKEFKERRARATKADEPLQNGQTTLNIRGGVPQRAVESHEVLDTVGDGVINGNIGDEEDPVIQPSPANRRSLNKGSHRNGQEDVVMD